MGGTGLGSPPEDRESPAALADLLTAVHGSLELRDVLARVLEAARRLLGTEWNVVLLCENGDLLVPQAWDGAAPPALADARCSASAGVLGRALATREPLALEPFAGSLPRALASLGAGLAVSLVAGEAGERAVGVLVVAPVAPRRFSKTEERVLRRLGDEAATAIDHAQRHREATARGERLATLLQFTERVATHRPYDDLLAFVAEEARRLLGATVAALRLVDGDELAAPVSTGGGAGPSGSTRLKFGEGLSGRVVATGRPLQIADAGDESGGPDPAPVTLLAAGLRSYLGVPLLTRERVTGVLSVYGAEPDRFTRDDVALLSAFASQAAVAVENARLVQQLLHAERLSAVGRIVAGVAHELNNPLAVVIGTTDLLRREEVNGRVAERLLRISGQAQRAIKIVRSLLALVRKKPAQRTEVDVNQLLGETLELEGYELRTARVMVVRKLEPDLPSVLGDPDQLQQVFTNLFLNACEAMREAHGGGTLTVATRRDEPRDRIVVTVADDGPGIRPADVHRVFEPFFTTKDEEKGTGLGLAICRQILDSHRGRISVESQPGAGATFTVELPAVRVAGRCAAEPGRPERGAARAVDVLLVEDERIVGDLLAEFLRLDGHRVDRAADGREALELVKGKLYGLIVSDVRMPDLDGPALYRELAKINADLSRCMLFVTGDVMSPETRRFLDETHLAYLEKPFGIAEFQSAIRGLLSKSSLGSPRPAPTA